MATARSAIVRSAVPRKGCSQACKDVSHLELWGSRTTGQLLELLKSIPAREGTRLPLSNQTALPPSKHLICLHRKDKFQILISVAVYAGQVQDRTLNLLLSALFFCSMPTLRPLQLEVPRINKYWRVCRSICKTRPEAGLFLATDTTSPSWDISRVLVYMVCRFRNNSPYPGEVRYRIIDASCCSYVISFCGNSDLVISPKLRALQRCCYMPRSPWSVRLGGGLYSLLYGPVRFCPATSRRRPNSQMAQEDPLIIRPLARILMAS